MAPTKRKNKFSGRGPAPGPSKISKKQKRQRKLSKNATFIESKAPGSPYSFSDLKTPGLINEKFLLGKLLDVRDEPNRTVFDFMVQGKTYDVWSHGANAIAIKTQLKAGVTYEIKGTGTIKADLKQKYKLGSNSESKFNFGLLKIAEVSEIPEPMCANNYDNDDNE